MEVPFFPTLFSSVRNLVVNQPFFPVLEEWLVNHPKIHEFSWDNGKTPGSSQRFLTLTVLSYIFFTFILSQVSRPSLARPVLKSISTVHNIFLVTLSFIMALGCLVSIFSQVPNFKTLVCFPKRTSPSGPLFFWGYIFYLSKIIEFMDTLLIILGNSMKRLSFLHVYHHSMVVIMSYVCVDSAQSSFSMVLVTNCAVHVVMYTYYLMCTLGVHPKWKKMVTDCQLVQFWASFLIMAMLVFYHFTGSGCSGVLSWCFNAAFIVSLLFLFSDFHAKNYPTKVKTKYA
ncbi:Pathoproteinsis-related thaumatin superfamily protein, putative isoform 1 [Hibiscus syriacus]|uniref:Pathoproteinsis-related thaumatin superfamily protein, putative isoform 1 n=1 Tax=Hibiscus syriacus TaxID=106335 RepID=A0A6A3B2G5_HIBSY|nr:elongation of fatty acids protein A-like [Hibiscus syriacus]KAE8709279.1 Pathoproteinsis-related thaumatin superfamily protein, putative isoform 1 [Hibiscus syriacus]